MSKISADALRFFNKLSSQSREFRDFVMEDYDCSKYKCEIADVIAKERARDTQWLIEFWNKKVESRYFELKHPVYNDLTTRAVYSWHDGTVYNFVYFVDEDGKHPWWMIQYSSLINIMITEDKILLLGRGWGISGSTGVLLGLLKNLDINKLVYKDIEFGFILSCFRPGHYTADILPIFLRLKNAKITRKSKTFFMSKTFKFLDNEENIEYVTFLPTAWSNPAFSEPEIVKDMWKKESLEEFDSLVEAEDKNGDYDLTIWLGIPGERRLWIDQFEGIPQIIKNIAQYFPKIKVYIDGMTSYDRERNVYPENQKHFEHIKAEVDKLGLNITMKSLSGYDYRTKMCYCYTCDIAISDIGTTILVPFVMWNKPGVAFAYNKALYDQMVSAKNNYNFNYLPIEFKHIYVRRAFGEWSCETHIPWQALYNLSADVLEKIKNIKMHRLSVPPVETVAKIYDLQKMIENQDKAIKYLENQMIHRNNKNSAVEIIKNHLSYKLGKAMIENSKSILGFIKMPFILWNIKKEHRILQIYKSTLNKIDISLLPDYKESLEYKNHMSYKLGQVIIKACKNWYKGGFIKLIFDIQKIKNK